MTVPVSVVPLYLAVMVAVPTPFAVIAPLLPTVATDVLLDVHVKLDEMHTMLMENMQYIQEKILMHI